MRLACFVLMFGFLLPATANAAVTGPEAKCISIDSTQMDGTSPGVGLIVNFQLRNLCSYHVNLGWSHPCGIQTYGTSDVLYPNARQPSRVAVGTNKPNCPPNAKNIAAIQMNATRVGQDLSGKDRQGLQSQERWMEGVRLCEQSQFSSPEGVRFTSYTEYAFSNGRTIVTARRTNITVNGQSRPDDSNTISGSYEYRDGKVYSTMKVLESIPPVTTIFEMKGGQIFSGGKAQTRC